LSALAGKEFFGNEGTGVVAVTSGVFVLKEVAFIDFLAGLI